MKTKLIISIALMCLICTGCKKHECAELSWTDYNSVEDVHCNFKYYADEYMTHKGDTLKVYGWLYESDIPDTIWYTLTCKKELQFCHNASLLYSNSYVSCFLGKHNCLMPENPYDSLLFVTGTINYYVECGVTAFSIVPTNIKKNVRAKNKEQ